MKRKYEYHEGDHALHNFRKLTTAILQAPHKKKKQAKRSASQTKRKKSGRG